MRTGARIAEAVEWANMRVFRHWTEDRKGTEVHMSEQVTSVPHIAYLMQSYKDTGGLPDGYSFWAFRVNYDGCDVLADIHRKRAEYSPPQSTLRAVREFKVEE